MPQKSSTEVKKDSIKSKESKNIVANNTTPKVSEKKKIKFPKISADTISSKLLLPMSIVFLSVCLSASLIVSSLIVSKSIEKISVGTSSGTTANNTTTTSTTPTPTPVPISIDQIKTFFTSDEGMKFGDANRKVLFVEFSDPSCPFCHVAGGKDPELNKQMGDNFKMQADGGSYVAPVLEMKKLVDEGKASYAWVYTNGHGNGEMGTQALYCANDKGKFWEAHDLLYSNSGYNLLNTDVKNDKANSQKLADFLKNIVDPTEMNNCLQTGKYAGKITSNNAAYQTLTSGYSDRRGTPTFFINTAPFFGAYSFADMKPTVDAALQ